MTSTASRRVIRFIAPVLLLIFRASPLSAQTETILESYERIFIRSNLSTKVNVLADAAGDEAAGEFYGPLCERALRFVADNVSLFRDDPDMTSVTLIAVRGVETYAYRPAGEVLRQLFLRFPENAVRDEILRALPVLGSGESDAFLNDYLAELNHRYVLGQGVDPLFGSVLTALGALGNTSSYPVLFASILVYSGDLEAEARRAIYAVGGDLTAFCTGVIINNPPEEKLEAYRLAMNREGISPEEQGLLSEAALEASLSGPRREGFRDLAVLPLRFIRESGRVRALPLVLKYYNQSLAAFRADPSRREDLAGAIGCLSALRDTESARALSLQLGLYNSRAASLSSEEREIALALIIALGGLGYKASSDSLRYAGTQPYPEELREAAREALAKLQW